MAKEGQVDFIKLKDEEIEKLQGLLNDSEAGHSKTVTELKEMKKNAESLAKEKEELKCTVNEKEEHVQRCEDTINVLKSSVEDLWRNAFPKDPPCNHLIGDIHDTKWEVFEGIKNQFAKLKNFMLQARNEQKNLRAWLEASRVSMKKRTQELIQENNRILAVQRKKCVEKEVCYGRFYDKVRMAATTIMTVIAPLFSS
jgi:iron-sulfur cluster repair protein YtfE (RIC family)